MYLTEKEANTKWCPDARVCTQDGRGGGNRFDPERGAQNTIVVGSMCIGSACMAWRWGNDKQKKPADYTVGFCGRAGRPTPL